MPNFDVDKIVSQPIFFERNRVFRVYLGGAQYSSLCGDKNEDTMFPEEWIASKVKAINPKYFGKRDGVSVVKGTDIYFDDLLMSESAKLLGDRKYDCLVKYLDSAIRLPVQVHPTKEFSRKHFNSDYGKTEAWLVIATRENAKIYFGFNRKIDKKTLSDFEERSLNEKDIMQSILQSVDAKVGDVYLINAGLIHAIGAGCTIIEVQEPTDFTIQPENWCGDYHITENEKYIGLSKSDALDCFNFDLFGKSALDSAKVTPKTVVKTKTYKKEELITYQDTPCFAENRHTICGGSFTLQSAPSVWIVLDGDAEIVGENYVAPLHRGDYFFLPYAASNKFTISSCGGSVTLIECLPSKNRTI
ncbi:MAG: class I mannose-6-phosphate isomerase [Clostridia bacterium]